MKNLALDQSVSSDLFISNLSRCKHLTSLSLTNAHFDDASVKMVCDLQHLRSLKITSTFTAVVTADIQIYGDIRLVALSFMLNTLVNRSPFLKKRTVGTNV